MGELPFTTEQFLGVFHDYNMAIWPTQIIAYILGAMILVLSVRKTFIGNKIINASLGIFWIWMGIVYHLMFFSTINKLAYIFGGFFIVQGGLFLFLGFTTQKLQYQFRSNNFGITGLFIIIYAMLIYPMLGSFWGHAYPYAPMFGVAPCPTTIFTFGILLWTKDKIPGWLLIIPSVWSVIGLTAAVKLGMVEDFGLMAAAVISVTMLGYRAYVSGKIKSQKIV